MWLNSSVWEYDFEKRKKNNHKESTNIKVQEKKKVIHKKSSRIIKTNILNLLQCLFVISGTLFFEWFFVSTERSAIP